MALKLNYDRFGRSDQQLVFGHEFSGRVAEYGPKCKEGVASGTPVVALPLLRGESGVDTTGSPSTPPVPTPSRCSSRSR